MRDANKHIRHGVGSVRPYLYGRLDMLELVKRAFGAVELEHLPVGKGAHVEAKIGDSMIVMEVSDPPHPSGKPASIYVYVDDVDAAYQRALAAGATSMTAPEDKPYQERAAGVKDSFGNVWWIATYTG
jgi:PhnB protein